MKYSFPEYSPYTNQNRSEQRNPNYYPQTAQALERHGIPDYSTVSPFVNNSAGYIRKPLINPITSMPQNNAETFMEDPDMQTPGTSQPPTSVPPASGMPAPGTPRITVPPATGIPRTTVPPITGTPAPSAPRITVPPATGTPATPTTPRTTMPPTTGMPATPTTPRTTMPPTTGMPATPATPRTTMPPTTGMPATPATPRTTMPPTTGMPATPATPRTTFPPTTGVPVTPATPRTTVPPATGMPAPGMTTPGMPMPGMTTPGMTTPGMTIPGMPAQPGSVNPTRTQEYRRKNDTRYGGADSPGCGCGQDDYMYMPDRNDYSYHVPMGVPMMPLYGYDNCEDADRDWDYMRQMYPMAAKKILIEIDDECDKLEYDGSCMFDEYPDRVYLGRIVDRIFDKVKYLDDDLAAQSESDSADRYPYGTENDTSIQISQFGREDYDDRRRRDRRYDRDRNRRDYGNNFRLRDLIEVILFNELLNRRRRYRGRRRWF